MPRRAPEVTVARRLASLRRKGVTGAVSSLGRKGVMCLPRLLEEHRLLDRAPGVRSADEHWIGGAARPFCGPLPGRRGRPHPGHSARAGHPRRWVKRSPWLSTNWCFAIAGGLRAMNRRQSQRKRPRQLHWRSCHRFPQCLAQPVPSRQHPEQIPPPDPCRLSGGPQSHGPRR